MKVNPSQYGRLAAVTPSSAGVMLPYKGQVSAASKIVKARGKKSNSTNTRPLNAYIAYRCE